MTISESSSDMENDLLVTKGEGIGGNEQSKGFNRLTDTNYV